MYDKNMRLTIRYALLGLGFLAGAIALTYQTDIQNAFAVGAYPYAVGGTGTTTAQSGQVLYSGRTSYQNVATSSVSAGTGISFTGTAGYLVGGTALTISATADAYQIATTSTIAVPQVAYFTKTSGLTTLGGVSTTTLTVGGGLGTTGTAGALVGGTNFAITNPFAVATTTTIARSGVAYFSQTSANTTLDSVATSSVSCSSGVSCGSTSYVLNGALSITNSGVLSNVAGTAISVSGATGNVTINNTSPAKWATTTTDSNAVPRISPAGALLVGIGTTTPRWKLQVASSSLSATAFGQFALSDSNAGANLKHWLFTSEGGDFYIGTTTDAFATSTPTAFTIKNTGNIRGSGKILTPGAQISVSFADPNYQTVTLTANGNITFTATSTYTKVNVELCQDSTGSRTVTWGATMHWQGGSAPTLTTTAGKCDMIGLWTSSTTNYINGVSSLNY